MAGVKQRCTTCTSVIPLWDTHTVCKSCRPCTAIKYRDCPICSSWDDPTWALYLETATTVTQEGQKSPGEVNAEFTQPEWYIQAQKEQLAMFKQLLTSSLPPAKATKKRAQKKPPVQRKAKSATAPSATVTTAPTAPTTAPDTNPGRANPHTPGDFDITYDVPANDTTLGGETENEASHLEDMDITRDSPSQTGESEVKIPFKATAQEECVPTTTQSHVQILDDKGCMYSVPFSTDTLGVTSLAFSDRISLVAALAEIKPVESTTTPVDWPLS